MPGHFIGPRVETTLPMATLLELERVAERKKLKRAEAIREAVIAWLERHRE